MFDPFRAVKPRAAAGFVLAALSAAFFAAPPLAASDGSPLAQGIAAFDQGGSLNDTARAVAVQPDGKIVLAGTVATGAGTWALGLARFLPSGALDPGFGLGGRVVNPFGVGHNLAGAALTLLADGRILVAGTMDWGAGDQDFYVGRLLASGSPDTTFAGGAGGLAVPFDLGGDATDTLAAMTVDRSGRILLAGSVDVSPTDTDFGVARLTANGALDPAFSGNGKATVPVSTATDLGLALAWHTSGIVVAGAAWTTAQGGHFNLALARLLADGSLDTSFGPGGTVIVGMGAGGSNNEFAWAVGVWPDGEIVAAGDIATGVNSWMWLLERFSPSGDFLGGITGAFCSAGTPPCPVAPQDSPRALLLEGDGKILFAGFGPGPAGSVDFGVGRYTRGLAPDLGFGVNGTTTYDFNRGPGADADAGMAMTFDRDGRIVVAGSAEWSGLDTDFAWVRLDNDYIFANGFE